VTEPVNFRVGQKVVCIDDGRYISVRVARRGIRRFLPHPFTLLDHNLNRGDVYRITKIEFRNDAETAEPVPLLSVDGARHFEYPNIGFLPGQFRPVVEKKTDISVFTDLLNPAPAKETEAV
jgi:hypothetical protein